MKPELGCEAHAAELLPCSLVPTSPFAVWFETTRDIAAGEELLLDYGQGYWDATVAMPLHKYASFASPLWRLVDPRRIAIDYL